MNEIIIIRATSNKTYKKYIKNQISYQKNTCYVALKNDTVIATCEVLITSQRDAIIDNIHYLQPTINLEKEFMAEFSYWNPFIKTITYKEKVFETDKHVELFKIPILDIRVEQLSVSKAKLENVLRWVKTPEDIIVNVVKIDGKIICIDGYTRLTAAYLKGFDAIYCFYEIDPYDEEDYKEFLSWCETEQIYTIEDLKDKIVSEDEHQRIWIDRCQNYFKNKK